MCLCFFPPFFIHTFIESILMFRKQKKQKKKTHEKIMTRDRKIKTYAHTEKHFIYKIIPLSFSSDNTEELTKRII